jgi:hypothetical protein
MAGIRAPEAIINGKLFASPDFPETVQEDLVARSAHCQIRIATMINELGATSSYRTIELRAPIQTNRVSPPCFPRSGHCYGTTHDFPLTDPFTRIPDDLLARRNRLLCEHAKSFDARAANAKLEIGKLRVETRNMMLRDHIH